MASKIVHLSPQQRLRSRRGIALISVLAMVMLLTALIVAFMMRAGSERQASGFYRAEATTRDLSDTTLNLVEGLINEATTQGITYAWTSQPGAIRVFDNTGAPAKTFKLYSAPSMVSATTSLTGSNSVQTFLSADVPSATWYTAPGMWVDLNAPVNTDPAPTVANNGLGLPQYTHFPILDPRDPTTSTKIIAMDGFSITNAPTDKTGTTSSYIDSNNVPNPAPMPVQWLYVLQNGAMTAPTSGPDASGRYTFGGIAPAANNPIVGRIAFWTDDETCKVNVNTAGADGIMGTTKNKDRADPNAIANGTFWSPPYFAAIDDSAPSETGNTAYGSGPFGPGYCTSLPSQGEYQRYPGHPATVALSNILNTLRPISPPATPYFNTVTFYSQSSLGAGTQTVTGPGITPRYVYGGTQENTVNTFGTGAYESNNAIQYGAVANAVYRLYPTLSELLFNPTTTRAPTANLNTSDAPARQRMETGRFFLTAHSRAPELNLFGLPRVSIWPMAYNAAVRTATDNLIGFCTTIGGTQGNATDGSAYYFTRAASYDSTVDIGLKDSSGINRNAYLLNYLDYLTKQNIPGFGGNFYTKDYGNGLTGQTDQILTEIFDYVRATNIQDVTSSSPYGLSEWQGSWWGMGQVVPSLINNNNSEGILHWNTQGYASFPRLVEASLQFVAMGRGGVPANAYGAGNPPTNINAIPINPTVVSCAFPNPSLPTTPGINYPYPPALPPDPGTVPGAIAYNAFASQNPLGYLLGYPATPTPVPPNLPITQGDDPYPATLTYAYVALIPPNTVPISWSLDYPYAPPGTISPPTSSYPNPTTNISAPPKTGPYNTIYRVHNYETGLDSGIPPDGTNAVQCFLLLTFINPAQDWVYCSPYVWASVSGLSNFAINSHPLGFTDPDCMVFGSGQDWHGGGRSGYTPIDINFQAKGLSRTPGQVNTNPTNGNPFFSNIIPITSDNTPNSTMAFTGGSVTIKLYDAPGGPNWPPPGAEIDGSPANGHLVQTYRIDFPNTPKMAVPSLPATPTPVAPDLATYQASPDTCYPPNSALPLASYQLPQQGTGVPYLPWVTPYIAYNNPSTKFTVWPQTPGPVTCFERTGPIIGLGEPAGSTPYDYIISCYTRWGQYGATIGVANENLIGTGDVVNSMVLSQNWSTDPRMLSISNVPAGAFVQHPNWGQQFAHNIWWGMVLPSVGNGSWLNQSWETYYTGGPLWPNTASVGTLAGNVVDPQPAGWPTFAWAPCNSGSSNSANGNNQAPKTLSGAPPDWDSGLTTGSDGPWINKADEGSGPYGGAMPYYANPVNQPACQFTANREVCSPGMLGSLPTGVDSTGVKPVGWQTLLFRPGPGAANAVAATNGLLQTCGPAHPGEGIPAVAGVYSPPYISPPDHLWMDLFWIPVTEPYAISEPMSTAGKINLNYQILPFTYIKRATALRAAMATEKIAQVGLLQSATCKGNSYQQGVVLNGPWINYQTNLSQQVPARYPIDLDVTLSQFDKKFNNWDVFRSASQICENFLVPMDIPNTLPNGMAAAASPGTFWENITPTGNYSLPANSGDTTGVGQFAKDWYVPVTTPQDPTKYTNAPFAMIGDNLREQPYAHLYGKLTTKSNTFTVYYRVQALRQSPTADPTKWTENPSGIAGEYRGSTTIERFIDPNEKTGGVNVVPDAAVQLISGNPTSLEGYYKWRVVENHQFAP